MIEQLDLFHELTTIFSGQKYITISCVAPLLSVLYSQLEQLEPTVSITGSLDVL